MNFYGFNGYQAEYNSDYEDDSNPATYISRVYYRHERNLLKTTLDLQGKINGKKLRWLAGLGLYKMDIATVNIDNLNKDLSHDKKLPNVPLLYDKYVEWNIIPENQKNGGDIFLIKTGLVYDTRDIEANPMSGIWTEAILTYNPKISGNNSSFSILTFTHRQYFTLAPKVLNLALRLSYQGKIGGNIPFYMLPFYVNSYQVREGFGGAKTIRGILRDRVVGDGVAFGNAELRWKILRTIIFKQNFYIALSAFMDGARVIQPYSYNDPLNKLPKFANEDWHFSSGAGLHFALNENFIVAVDYGKAFKRQDGKQGVYINLNFLY